MTKVFCLEIKRAKACIVTRKRAKRERTVEAKWGRNQMEAEGTIPSVLKYHVTHPNQAHLKHHQGVTIVRLDLVICPNPKPKWGVVIPNQCLNLDSSNFTHFGVLVTLFVEFSVQHPKPW